MNKQKEISFKIFWICLQLIAVSVTMLAIGCTLKLLVDILML